MKTAGVVFDFYDDPRGRILKEVFPTPEDLPDFIKTAHILSPTEREILRDDAFALVMQNEGKILRKFACVDPGNTLISLLYFEKTAELLPEEAREAARQALLARAIEQGFVEQEKTAAKEKKKTVPTSMSRTRDSALQPTVGDEADWAARTNLISVRGGADSGRVIPTANQMNMKTAGAEAAAKGWGSAVKPHLDKALDFVKKNPWQSAGLAGAGVVAGRMSKNAGVEKTAAVRAVPNHFEGTEENDTLAGLHDTVEQLIGRAPIDVTGKEPKPKVEHEKAKLAALEHYPLDSYADVRAAVDYFSQSWTAFNPQDRHEFCKLAAPRAYEIGLEVPELMLRYGSTEYAPDVEAHLASRRANSEPKFHEVYDALQEKQAELDPEMFAELLCKADSASGLSDHWGGAVQDPWYSTFGGQGQEKTAFGWEGGGYQVDAEKLQGVAASGALKGSFEDDLVKAFEKDPVAIFSSLPDDTKALIAQIATEA